MEPLIRCEHMDLGYENQDAVVDVNMEVCPRRLSLYRGRERFGKKHADEGASGPAKAFSGRSYGIGGTENYRNRLSSPADGRPEGFPGVGP